MAELDYIHHKTGFLDRSKNLGRETRFWPTPKMIDLFLGFKPANTMTIARSRPVEIIQLKDDGKILIDYQDEGDIRDMRLNLQRYNEFIGGQRLEVVTPAEVKVNFQFLEKLEVDITKGVLEFNEIHFWETSTSWAPLGEQAILNEDVDLILTAAPDKSEKSINQIIKLNHSTSPHITNYLVHISDRGIRTPNIEFLHHLSHISTMTKAIRNNHINFKQFYSQNMDKLPLSDFGLAGLDFRWAYPYLHRVFNKGSFKLGGRFFGGYHLELPKELRAHIKINGLSTIEADYSALHIRMLYHLEDMDYHADPYIDVCESPEERKIYKLVLLIAINADNETTAVQAIRSKLREERVFEGLTDHDILNRLARFKSVHQRIGKYMNTGIGLYLQNLDSRITEIILKNSTEKGIPCLPVHDSYIVPRCEKDFLLGLMVKAYQQVMNGFEPQIDIKNL
ncbi:MAG: hypothetical protein HQK55_00390 [Deltaproteobacteria bacterium]|nr:hypothetical protein [Deltaproteobacteria bacterium]